MAKVIPPVAALAEAISALQELDESDNSTALWRLDLAPANTTTNESTFTTGCSRIDN